MIRKNAYQLLDDLLQFTKTLLDSLYAYKNVTRYFICIQKRYTIVYMHTKTLLDSLYAYKNVPR